VAALRGIYALSRDGRLPSWLAATNNRGAPHHAAEFVLGLAVLVVAAGFFVPAAERFQTLFVTATAQALLLVLVYTALAVGALRLMWRSPDRQPLWRWMVFSAATVVPGLALYGTFVPFPGYPERFGLFAGIVALFTVALWVFRVGGPPANPSVKQTGRPSTLSA
jgi:amino acid transporter